MPKNRPIQFALLSVSNKKGIIKFAKDLSHRKVKLISTSGTAKLLLEAGLKIIEISEYTKWPEMMGGRVKTLHPKIHGGILGRRGKDDKTMQQHHIMPIDMIVVNLHPFYENLDKQNYNIENAVEQIDIGGTTMIRAAAKNYNDVAIVINPTDYCKIIQEMDSYQNSLTDIFRFELAVKAFKYTADYEKIISDYFNKSLHTQCYKAKNRSTKFPDILNLSFIKKENIRYGENTHQDAAFYIENNQIEPSVSTAKQMQGKSLSYNNIADCDTALECVKNFSEPACVIVKHTTPCSVAISSNIYSAYNCAFKTDPISAFGGVIAFNRELDENTAKTIIKKQFVEVIIAPSINNSALGILSNKPKIRVLASGQLDFIISSLDFKRVNGGLLLQDRDLRLINKNDLCIVSKRHPSEEEIENALFSWKVAKFVKSNAIVYAKNNMTIGIGSGQTSRIYSAKIAILKAKEENLDLTGCSMASDAFIPFRDTIDISAKAGIRCIIQPGGSIHDDKIINAVNECNISMIFTKIRHFRH